MAQNEAKDAPKRPPKTTRRGTQEAQKSDPESKDEKRTEPRRSQDRLGPPTRRLPPAQRRPRGSTWEAKMVPKPTPKRSKFEAKIQDEKKAIQDDLGPVLERSWVDLGCHLGRLGPQNRALALGGARFFEKSLFRC